MDWKDKLQEQAALMRKKASERTDEQKAESKRKASETRRKNREARAAAGVPQPKIGRPRKSANLDELAQSLGFGSASEALLDLAVHKAGFASVQEAALWAVQQKTKKTPVSAGSDAIVTVLSDEWDDNEP